MDRLETAGKVEVSEFLREGDAVRWGRFEAQVLHTPGHSQGSVCLYMPSDMPEARTDAVAAKSAEREPGRLFAGDTLFAGSIGRTDLWGGSLESIMRSLKARSWNSRRHNRLSGHGPLQQSATKEIKPIPGGELIPIRV